MQVELFYPRLVGGDGGAFDADAVELDRLSGLDGDLIVGLVALVDAEIEIFEIDLEAGVNKLVLDQLPNDPGHLVAVHLDDGVGDLDFGHGASGPVGARSAACSDWQ